MADSSFLTMSLNRPVTPLNLYVSKTGVDVSPNGFYPNQPCLTIGFALNLLKPYCAGNQYIIINLGNGDWAEDITINGRLWGDLNYDAIPNIGSLWSSMLIFQGNGAANTTISGTGNYGGTLIISNSAIVGLKNLKITGNKNGFQSPIFAQLGGYIHIFGGVEIGAAGAEQLHCENAGSSIQIWENYTLSGGGTAAFACSDQGDILVSAGVGTITGTPSYTSAFIFARSGGSVQFNIAAPFSGPATGAQFNLFSAAILEIPLAISLSAIPGNSAGVLRDGGIFRIGGNGYVTVNSSTGTGTGGTTTVASQSGPGGGIITITAGTAASNTGQIVLNVPWLIQTSDGSLPFITGNLVNGTGTWPLGSMLEITHSGNTPVLTWRTGTGAALTSGSTYLFIYSTATN